VKWFLVQKNKETFPVAGTYKQWKRQLRVEGRGQCVYCAISEARFGGYRNFHVEHFRPKSRFKALVDDYGNLFYVCSICNAFKGNHWPENDPPDDSFEQTSLVYPPPHLCDIGDVIEVSEDGVVSSKYEAGRFLIERVYLNRPQLIRARRMSRIKAEVESAFKDVTESMTGARLDSKLSARVASAMQAAMNLINTMADAAPYEPDEIERQG
jgi:hypothetical protein